ncbi:raf kinase inhibitor [Plasmodium brasilianum]|uniref:Raf kinase inhibitor, putative n=2 Tax=Plasmodium (Plasmodium) TaxID=418103 RepID=A0A1A8WV89_PLAMA|nr:raf kinase inhibitor, putative [Plasmodium malariae]KAI4834914.1 raf kinase inhibitor [Plasmodium brasilianum]SBS95779.1 raf kinase inhibitor, putative (RKIP) [Plasmodium malariae]SCP03482.1 raf kinase inhibitor, putative [Plasmodium malariae]
MAIPTIEELKKEKIIPHVFPDENINLSIEVFISFKAGKEVNHGNILDLCGTGSTPRNIKFSELPPDGYCFVLFMVDSDYPSRKRPDGKEYVHWVVSGIKSNELIKGTEKNCITLLPYVGPSIKKGTGLHRISFIISLIKEEDKDNIIGVPIYRGENYITRVKFNNYHSAYNIIQINNMKIVGYNWCQIEA